ncbi:Hypothetical_protein [Hexamita inflata]|uniref:Hypothetical_protein n=1 Tax=Hexamita inflata TaxID=28002 RepID=A0AA86RMB9_9EUKA|nr:Hypothetical protein HINF_LOCUS64856 [Hexamita inflata]CAI9977212.1 Hypothetical protein HINF_LOCUS64857 [Hexamita inflata]
MTFVLQQFMDVSAPVLQAINYSFSGINSIYLKDMNDIFYQICLLDEMQSQEFWITIAHIYNCEIEYLKKWYKQQLKSSQFQASQSRYQSDNISLIPEETDQTSSIYLKIDNQIRNALIQVASLYNNSKINSALSDKQLCILVNNTVKMDRAQKFWKSVAALVPSKSKKQIYDFYHNSFSKALFDQKLSREDRKYIQQLNMQYPEKKPAKLAEIFLENTGRQILKHNIIMMLVNIRRSTSDSE